MKIVLIGFGGIGRIVAQHLSAHEDTRFVGVAARVQQSAHIRNILGDVPLAYSSSELLALAPDLVIECASQEAFREYAETVLGAGIDLIAVSVGVLADGEYRGRVLEAATRTRAVLEIPAGAIGGIDVLAAAKNAGINRVVYVTWKSPRAWAGTRAESMVDLSRIHERTLFFDDTAERAAMLFPEKANVTATLALAGVGFKQTRVQFWVDPALKRSTHHIEAEGACGKVRVQLENEMSKSDGETSLLTAMSIVRSARNRMSALRI